MKATLRIVYSFLRVRALHELQYRSNFFLSIIESTITLLTGLGAIWLVFDRVDELNGWDRNELLIVLGTYTALLALVGAFVEPAMLNLIQGIRDGSFDHLLLKPVDAQLITALRQFRPWRLVDVLVGAVVAGFGLSEIEAKPGLLDFGAFLGLFLVGFLTIYSFWLLAATLSFWVVRMDAVAYTFQGAYQAGRWPVSIYPGWLRLGLTVLVPIGIAVTAPAEALSQRLGGGSAVVAVAVGLVAVVGSRWFFGFGVRRYSGASA